MLKRMLKRLAISAVAFVALLSACAAPPPARAPAAAAPAAKFTRPFVISAIPDQDPEKLNRGYVALTDYLSKELGVPVEYKPVTDYAAVVTAFKVGDVDMVWFGGLTGVQARLQVEGAEAILQRDIDEKFTSTFIASKASGIAPVTDAKALAAALKGRTFTFGSDSSTSGRLMPQYFMQQGGLALTDLKGEAGFSGSHDKTIKLVEAGTFEAGALNSQVWASRVAKGEVDLEKVQVIWQSPTYYDYHWIIRPDVAANFGPDFATKLKAAFIQLNADTAEHKDIMGFFGAKKFIETKNDNYAAIEQIGREIGKIK
jgi:phosphonate transport system substrate-binding protein